MDHVDRAGERGRAEVHRRRTAHHLDALDVVQADRLDLRDERAAGRNAVDQQQQVVHLANAQQAGNGAGRTGVAAGRDADAAEQRQRGAQVGGAAGADFVAGDDADRAGHFLDRFTKTRGGDLNGILKRRRSRCGDPAASSPAFVVCGCRQQRRKERNDNGNFVDAHVRKSETSKRSTRTAFD